MHARFCLERVSQLHTELIDGEFTTREATLAFMWSRLRVANESDPRERRRMTNLRFEDFCEALVRIATMKCVPTDAGGARCAAADSRATAALQVTGSFHDEHGDHGLLDNGVVLSGRKVSAARD